MEELLIALSGPAAITGLSGLLASWLGSWIEKRRRRGIAKAQEDAAHRAFADHVRAVSDLMHVQVHPDALEQYVESELDGEGRNEDAAAAVDVVAGISADAEVIEFQGKAGEPPVAVTADDLKDLVKALPDLIRAIPETAAAAVEAAVHPRRPFPWLQLIATILTSLVPRV